MRDSVYMTVSSNRLSRRAFVRRSAASAMGLAASYAQQRGGLKIFVLWDMEGSSGIFTREQAWYWEQGVRENVPFESRELFTADVNSLSAAALEAGVSSLIVCDTHHGGGNLIQADIQGTVFDDHVLQGWHHAEVHLHAGNRGALFPAVGNCHSP